MGETRLLATAILNVLGAVPPRLPLLSAPYLESRDGGRVWGRRREGGGGQMWMRIEWRDGVGHEWMYRQMRRGVNDSRNRSWFI